MVLKTKTEVKNIVADTTPHVAELQDWFESTYARVSAILGIKKPVALAISMDRTASINGQISKDKKSYELVTMPWHNLHSAEDTTAYFVHVAIVANYENTTARQGRYRKNEWAKIAKQIPLVKITKLETTSTKNDAFGFFGWSIELSKQGKQFLADLKVDQKAFFTYKEIATGKQVTEATEAATEATESATETTQSNTDNSLPTLQAICDVCGFATTLSSSGRSKAHENNENFIPKDHQDDKGKWSFKMTIKE